MMESRPVKFRVLEILKADILWNHEIVKQLQDEYSMKSDYGRDCLNFDLIEMAASGMIVGTELSIDEAGEYKEGSLLIRYSITSLGKSQLKVLEENITKGGKSK